LAFLSGILADEVWLEYQQKRNDQELQNADAKPTFS